MRPIAKPAILRAAYRWMLVSGLAPLTIRRAHDALRLALKQAIDDRIVDELVTSRVRVPRQDRRTTWALSAEEAARRLAVGSPYTILWFTLLYTGLRIGELLALQAHDLVRRPGSNPVLYVRRSLSPTEDDGWTFTEYTKTQAGLRAITLPVHVADALDAHHENAPASPYSLLFPTSRGTPYSVSNVNHYLRRDAENAVSPLVWPDRRLHPHILRHSYASALLAEHRPIHEVAYVLGHASPEVTLRLYSHWVTSDTSAAADALTARYGPLPARQEGPDQERPKQPKTGATRVVIPQLSSGDRWSAGKREAATR